MWQVWKQKVFPHLKQHFAKELDSVTSYMPLHHEASVTNLLEVTLLLQRTHKQRDDLLPDFGCCLHGGVS